MIKLDVQPYCHECPEFKAETAVIEYSFGSADEHRDTIIVCEHRERCRAMEDNIRERIQNEH